MTKVRIASQAEVMQPGCRVYQVNGHTLALFVTDTGLYAVDNRCPHMGFPLDRGSVKDGILTCHWHHARFDLASGGAFDLFADDVTVYPVMIEGEDVWVDLSVGGDPAEYYQQRLQDGLEQDLPLVIAKSVIGLVQPGRPVTATVPFRLGLIFGSRYRAEGWAMGQTIHTCLFNLLPHLEPADWPLALYQGLRAVARDTAGRAPRFAIDPLPGPGAGLATLKRWFRQFVEMRDGEGAERCLATAIQARASSADLADMLFAAATDHRYLSLGHVVDFTNKALEALDQAGWHHAIDVLPSLVPAYIEGTRMEERNAWRHPIDLAALLSNSFEKIPDALQAGRQDGKRAPEITLESSVPVLLGDDPQAIVDLLLAALTDGVSPQTLAQIVSYAATRRLVHFHTSNEFGDWDTVLHTFTYANAIQRAVRRAPSVELLRGVFDAAMSVYLDRFLNMPAAPLAEVAPAAARPDEFSSALLTLLDQRQQVNEAGILVARYLAGGGGLPEIMAALGRALLREDQDFHTIQAVEGAISQVQLLHDQPVAAGHALIAAARYLAAHAPTPRAQNQTYRIALRLQRGDKLFEG